MPALFVLFAGICCLRSQAQPLSGIWRGKVQVRQGIISKTYQLELHWERTGDSLRGYAFYYHGRQRFVQTTIEGSVNPVDGTVTWKDNRITDATIPQLAGAAFAFSADFNCPGEGVFKLDGEASTGDAAKSTPKGEVHLQKIEDPIFSPQADSILALQPGTPATGGFPDQAATSSKSPAPVELPLKTAPSGDNLPVTAATTIEDKFRHRKKQLVAEFPLSGDTLEIHFYDHAEIDGDSISLFIGKKLWKDHVLLRATPYTIKLVIADMASQTDLTMVAENLGTIPPNTSLMIAYINGQRHEARLESTENSSAMIRFTKPGAVSRQP